MPKADFLEFSLPSTHCILLSNEGTELTVQLIQQLESHGHQVVVLNLPNINNPIQRNGFDLSTNSDAEIANTISKIQKEIGKVGSFIHLHPHFEFQHGNFTQHFQTERDILKVVFFLAKHLHQDLNELGKTQRANFLTVTRLDGKLGYGKRGNTSIIGGGLSGLVKSLNLEWSPVFCRAVDIEPELPSQQIANQIIEELHDANVKNMEVGFSSEGRCTTFVSKTKTEENSTIQTKVTQDSVFLVSGGAKGVTATCVIEMAKAFQCKFVLLGRSDLNFEIPSYANGQEDEAALKRLIMNDMKERNLKPNLKEVKSIYNKIIAKREINDTLAKIEAHGAKASYLQGDVTQLNSFKAGLQTAVNNFGKI